MASVATRRRDIDLFLCSPWLEYKSMNTFFHGEKERDVMNIYVGNLSYNTNDNDLRVAFEAHGAVESSRVIMDKFSGKSKGFGFVEMPNGDEGNAAIEALNEQDLDGRALKVNEARPRPERSERGGGGGGGDRQRY